MIEVPIWFIVLVFIAFIVVIYIEAREYYKYNISVAKQEETAKAINSLAEGMQVTFDDVIKVINTVIDTQNTLIRSDLEQDQHFEQVDILLGVHSDALNTKLLTAIAKKVEKESI